MRFALRNAPYDTAKRSVSRCNMGRLRRQNRSFRSAIQAVWHGNKQREASFMEASRCVGVLGLEPRMTGPESVVLPLHHTPMSVLHPAPCRIATAKVGHFLQPAKYFRNYFATFTFPEWPFCKRGAGQAGFCTPLCGQQEAAPRHPATRACRRHAGGSRW